MVQCKFCSGNNLVKKGFRKLKDGKKQVYYCCNCHRKFTPDVSTKNHSPRLVLDAVAWYNQGNSFRKVAGLIENKYRVKISQSSIHSWVKELDMGISNSAAFKKGVTEKVFKHSAMAFRYKLHNGKLKFVKMNNLQGFLAGLCKGVDTKYLHGTRCSKLDLKVSVNVKRFKSKLNQFVGEVLKGVKHNDTRHGIVEDYMLNCDRDTVAVEVPVWCFDRNLGNLFGHIDVVQIKFGNVRIMDYKPNAAKENVDKVVSQLYGYALALSFRAGLPMSKIRCAWFDENDCFEFDADKVQVSDKFLKF